MNADLLAQAIKHCEDNGHRLTAPRMAVLRAVMLAGKPLGAYDIIAALPPGTKPPTVYRALEFWEGEGFIHRIGSMGVYTACHAAHRHAGGQFMLCRSCGKAEEIHLCHMPAPLNEAASRAAFAVQRWNLEIHGICRDCTA